jgi:hypothetical protein
MKLPIVIATLSLALVARAAHAEEPAVVVSESAPVASPQVRYPPSSVRPKLILGGLVISGLAYGVALGSAVSWPEVPGSPELKIPIAGPWIALGKSGCAKEDPDGPEVTDCGAIPYIRGVLYVIDGIAQLAGLGLVGEGIFIKTEAKSKPPKSLALSLPGGVTVHPVPMATARFTGLGFVGTF